MVDPFPIVEVPIGDPDDFEQLGTKRKFWFDRQPDVMGQEEPAQKTPGQQMLFKAVKIETGNRAGEDWAEKVVCELAAQLGVPHVHYEMAQTRSEMTLPTGSPFSEIVPGVVCERCNRQGQDLVHGNQLIYDQDPDYLVEQPKRHKATQHTVEAVAECMARIGLPSKCWMTDVPSEIASATDVFVGYLILDTLVANQDRHHENWAAVQTGGSGENGGSLCLAPTYDHGASLARNVSDQEKRERLESDNPTYQVPHFCRRARSALFADGGVKPLPTLDAATRFAQYARAAAAAVAWATRVGSLRDQDFTAIVDRVPNHRLSPVASEFTQQLLQANRQRIVDEFLS